MIPIPLTKPEARLCRDAAKAFDSKIYVEDGTVTLTRPHWLTLESALDAYLSEIPSGDVERKRMCCRLANDIATAVRNDLERRRKTGESAEEAVPAGRLF